VQDDVRVSVRWLDAIAPADVRPYHVQLEVTWRCNWRCVHCYQDDHSVEVLALADFERLFDELRAAGTMHLIITGGEPLVRGDLFDVLAAARGHGLAITLYTNGHRVTADVAARLAEAIALAEISILAGDDALHDELCRVRGAAARAWAGIEHLARVGVDVVVKTPLLAPAVATLPALDARVRGLGLVWNPDPELSRSYAGAAFPLAYALSPEQLARFYAALPQYRPRPGLRSADAGAPGGLCLAGRRFAFIDARGDVYPCLSFKTAGDGTRLGNIRDTPFAEIWRAHPMLSAIRAATRDSFGRCATCTGACSPCMAANFEEHGELFTPARARCHARRLPVLT
jgi:radical SAM protein with 4Fe4S-binding SPASM domain